MLGIWNAKLQKIAFYNENAKRPEEKIIPTKYGNLLFQGKRALNNNLRNWGLKSTIVSMTKTHFLPQTWKTSTTTTSQVATPFPILQLRKKNVCTIDNQCLSILLLVDKKEMHFTLSDDSDSSPKKKIQMYYW